MPLPALTSINFTTSVAVSPLKYVASIPFFDLPALSLPNAHFPIVYDDGVMLYTPVQGLYSRLWRINT